MTRRGARTKLITVDEALAKTVDKIDLKSRFTRTGLLIADAD